ncbi:MAG: hypothetical protein IPM39_23430 [Chloroflexi bacterium]|nr:hypothetical protein [Chloroflexota bacterium]
MKEKNVWKPAEDEKTSAPLSIWLLALIALALFASVVTSAVFGGPRNEVLYIVATPTPDTYYVRFLCLTNGDRMVAHAAVTWQRENGQVVDDVTNDVGCVIVPADEQIGVWSHVHQVTITLWPGHRAICQDIGTGIVQSGNLCPPG